MAGGGIMDTIPREQVDQLAQDIAFVKKAIQMNSSILQKIDFRSSLRLVVLLSAVSIFLFSILFHMLSARYHGFAGIPGTTKVVIYSAIALVAIILGILKNTGLLKSARAMEPGIPLMHLVREYYSIRIYSHFIPIGLVFVFFIACAVATGHLQLIVPLFAIAAGLIYNSLDALLRIKEFLWTSYWFMITGCILFVYSATPPLLGVCITFGCGLMLLSAIWYMPRNNRVEG
jgi:hypothetical protein